MVFKRPIEYQMFLSMLRNQLYDAITKTELSQLDSFERRKFVYRIIMVNEERIRKYLEEKEVSLKESKVAIHEIIEKILLPDILKRIKKEKLSSNSI